MTLPSAEKSRRSSLTALAGALAVVAGGTGLAAWALRSAFGRSTFPSLPLHSALEVGGGFLGIVLAGILLSRNRAARSSRSLWVSCVFIAMPVLDIAHGSVPVGVAFVWLHSLAVLAGGLFFALSLLPEWKLKEGAPLRVAVAVLFGFAVVSVASIVFADALPAMIGDDGQFTTTSRLMNLVGGVLTLAAGCRFGFDYVRGRLNDDLLFFCLCLAFGLAGVLFPAAELWDAVWWFWHGLRFLAYALAFAIAAIAYLAVEADRAAAYDLLAEEQEKTAYFLENTADLITVVSGTGELTYVNKAGSRIFGLTPQEAIGRSAFDFVHPDDRESTAAAFQGWIEERRDHATWENRNVSLAGEVRDMSWTIMPKYSPKGLESVWSIARDVTEAKAMLEDARTNEALLRELNEKLASSNSDLEQFAYVASHDLQEPLRMVANYTQLLGERYEGQLDEKADAFIGYARDGALRMQTLIQGLLQFSRLQAGAEELAVVSCSEVVSSVLGTLETSIQDSGAEVVVGDLPSVLADETQLGQVFQNLISNAIKFRGDAPPRIEIAAVERGEFWEISVEDNGIGMEPGDLEKIFVIFQRLHGRDQYQGTGIGLAIVKKIVERHGGQVRVESKPGEGSRFFFTLRKPDAG